MCLTPKHKPANDPSKSPSKGERTRDAIAEAAIRILCEEGYRSLTVAALAEGAGIRRNSYYTHFKDIDALIDELSLQVLDHIGARTFPATSSLDRSQSLVMSRLQFVLSLPKTDPTTALVLSELYVNHSDTAREVHRRLVLDMAVDRRRGLLRASGREAETASLVIAAGVMGQLSARRQAKRGDEKLFLSLFAKLCGFIDKPNLRPAPG